MTVAQQYVARQSGGRGGPSGLADVLDVLLDKGLVIDAFVRVSLVGIELLTIDARVVIAGVDTYLHFAEAVNRLDLLQVNNSQTVPEMFGARPNGSSDGGSPNRKSRHALDEGAQPHAEDEDTRAPERTGSDSGRDEGSSDDGGGGRNGKGLLSRLAERAQAF
jgi:gas vesicle structural protein